MTNTRIKYEVDPQNRLVISGGRPDKGLARFRRVLDGRFRIDDDNELSYHIKAPVSADEDIPNQVKIRGAWSLTEDHMLRITLEKEARKTFGDQITLQGELIDVSEDSILFAVTTAAKEGTASTYTLNLEGVWAADENNRLSFRVRREKGVYDILTFTGAWDIGKDYQVIYTYEKASLKRRKKNVHALIFKGRWAITDKSHISYVMGAGSDSAFDFKISACRFDKNYIKYELGVGMSRRIKPVKRTLALFGGWRIKRDTGLIFEIGLSRGRIETLTFGAYASLTDRDTVLFKLMADSDNRDIVSSVELSRNILKGDGEAFIRLLKSKGEAAIYAGSVWRW